MDRRTARCACGQLRIEVSGAPVRVSVCHCLDCQRRTGSAFGLQARFPLVATRTHGARSEYVRTGDGGGHMHASFCPQCGATVFYVLDTEPTLIAVPVGAFGDPGFPAPEVSFYEARMHGWLDLIGDMRHEH